MEIIIQQNRQFAASNIKSINCHEVTLKKKFLQEIISENINKK